MYNYIGRSNNTLLIIVCITTLCLRCYGSISNLSKTTNWTNAHMHCREEGKMLPNMPIHTLSNESYFWTGHYTRLSEWIKIIGCFEETAVNTVTKKSHEMYFPSAGRCQEVCLASNYSVFGVQLNTCVCLEQIPGQGSRGANDCSSSCSRKYPNETSITFQRDCGGNQTYNLFKSGSKRENIDFSTNDCLYIECKGVHRITKQKCNIFTARICNKTTYTEYNIWQLSSAECKSKHNSYLFGDVDLTNPRRACDFMQGHPPGPSWLGIAKELYISTYELNDGIEQIQRHPSITYQKKCLKCNKFDCTFADCNESNNVVCLPMQGTSSTTPTGFTTSTTPHGTVSISISPTNTTTSTTLHGTVSISTSPTDTTTSTTPHGTASTEHSTISIFDAKENVTGSTNKKNESMMNKQDGNTTVIMVVVPVSVIVILGLIALLLGIIWRRRQRKKTTDTKHAHHEPNLPKHSEKSDTNHSLRNNYFVLDKTETYSVVNHAKDKGRKSPHDKCNDGDYDHLGENVREKVKEEDNYHHAFFPSNEDEADYGTCIRNISAKCLMENPYSHTNTGDHHVTLEDNEYNTISINA